MFFISTGKIKEKQCFAPKLALESNELLKQMCLAPNGSACQKGSESQKKRNLSYKIEALVSARIPDTCDNPSVLAQEKNSGMKNVSIFYSSSPFSQARLRISLWNCCAFFGALPNGSDCQRHPEIRRGK